MAPARRFDDPRVPRRRPVTRVRDLLPDAARELGLEDQLHWSRLTVAWATLVGDLVPGATGGSRPARLDADGTLVVEVAAPIIGQEIRLRADDLLDALARMPGGVRAEALRVVVARGMIR